MPAAHTILVVGPDNELQRSVKFALEAEGFGVLTAPRLPYESDCAGLPAIACAVVDDGGLTSADRTRAQRTHARWPVVLLIDGFSTPAMAAEHILVKPLLGRSLVNAVLAALGST